jgi:hypothetical protein
MSRYDHLPLWRDASRLTVQLEHAVRGFPRYHKYAIGADLRRQALTVCRLIIVANTAIQDRASAVERLVLAVEELKLLIQMGKELRAFRSFKQFEQAAVLAAALVTPPLAAAGKRLVTRSMALFSAVATGRPATGSGRQLLRNVRRARPLIGASTRPSTFSARMMGA